MMLAVPLAPQNPRVNTKASEQATCPTLSPDQGSQGPVRLFTHGLHVNLEGYTTVVAIAVKLQCIWRGINNVSFTVMFF